MRVRMLRDQYGRDDADVFPQTFLAGSEYEVGPLLAKALFDLGAAEQVPETLPDNPKLERKRVRK